MEFDILSLLFETGYETECAVLGMLVLQRYGEMGCFALNRDENALSDEQGLNMGE